MSAKTKQLPDTSLSSFYVDRCADCASENTSCWYDHLTKKWILNCVNCGADAGWQETKQLAVDSWNDSDSYEEE